MTPGRLHEARDACEVLLAASIAGEAEIPAKRQRRLLRQLTRFWRASSDREARAIIHNAYYVAERWALGTQKRLREELAEARRRELNARVMERRERKAEGLRLDLEEEAA
jgi:hypothetical protein